MSVLKRNKTLAITDCTTWGTAEQPDTNDGYFVVSADLPSGGRNVWENGEEAGRGVASVAEVLEYTAQAGSFTMKAYVEGIEALIKAVMGTQQANQEITTGVIKKTYTLLEEMTGNLKTIAWEEGDQTKVIRSAVLNKMSFSISDGLNATFDFIGDKVSIAGWTDPLGSVTYESSGKSIHKLVGATVYISDFDDADFSDGNKVYPNNIEINVIRGFQELPATAGSNSVPQPLEIDAPTVELKLDFPKKDDTNKDFFNDFDSRTYKKAKVVFEVAGLATGYNYELAFYFPKLYLVEAPTYGFESPTPVSLSMKMLKADSAPTGMDYTTPYIVVQNALNREY